jgi:GT2 family glycosyltransferase
MINVCIPVLNNYSGLEKCVESVFNSSLTDCRVFIVDNGDRLNKLWDRTTVYRPMYNMGVAASWNWFIDNTDGIRIISNDDVIFDQYAIEQLLYSFDETRLSIPENMKNAFSCFLIPQHIIDVVGRFDETISPMYGYFEDDDYMRRMHLAGFQTKLATGSFVEHGGSTTLKNYTPDELESHHRKFRASRERYIKKWGGEPGHEVFRTPYNG